MTTRKLIVGGKVTLYEFQSDDLPFKIENGVVLNQFPDGEIYVHNWEPMDGGKTFVSFSLDNSSTARVYDWELEPYQEKIEIKKPKGLGWVYKYGSWRKPWE